MKTLITKKAWRQLHTIYSLALLYAETLAIMGLVISLDLPSIFATGAVVLLCIYALRPVRKLIDKTIASCYEITDEIAPASEPELRVHPMTMKEAMSR